MEAVPLFADWARTDMRLTTTQQHAIRQAIAQRDPSAEVYLFGSRADDRLQGGDIDLLVLSQTIGIMDKLDILAELHRSLGDQKIDLLVCADLSQPFARIAVEEGIRL
jgi:predicted nucleotidyltransferase